jgi:spore coat protein U-like protein
MKKFLLLMLVLSVCMLFSATAYAATETTTFDVSVTAVAACSVTATGITFPDYNGIGYVDGTGDVTVTCSNGVSYNIALDGGLQHTTWRRVTDGTNYLNYDLWKDFGQTSIWGDSDFENTYPTGSSYADTGTGTAQAHTVWGALFGGPQPPGAYSDTVTVTVHY